MSPARSVVLALLSLSTLAACGPEEGNGKIISEDRQVGNFTKVKVTDGLSVTILIGPRRVTLTTDENLADRFRFDVDGETLKLDRMGGQVRPTFAEIAISTPALEGLEVDNQSQVNAQGTQAADWRLTVNGHSNAVVNGLSATRFIIDARGQSGVQASGLTRDVDIDCHDHSTVDTGAVSAGNAKLDVSGGSLVTVNATQSIELSATGASRVLVSGNPSVRNDNSSADSEVLYTNQ